MGKLSQIKNGKRWFSSGGTCLSKSALEAGKLRSPFGICRSSPVSSADDHEARLESGALSGLEARHCE